MRMQIRPICIFVLYILYSIVNHLIYIYLGIYYSRDSGDSWIQSTGVPRAIDGYNSSWVTIASSSTGQFVVAGNHHFSGYYNGYFDSDGKKRLMLIFNLQLIYSFVIPVAILKEKFRSNPYITILCGDFFQHKGSYDYIVEQTFFCAIDPDLREAYAQQTHDLLRTNGKIIAILFNRSFEGGPPFGGSEEEYVQLFTPNFNILFLEANQQSIPQRMGSELFGVFEKK